MGEVATSLEKEDQALAIIRRLREAGFSAYLAGGCVRDRVLGVTAKDYDIATDARPEVVQRMFDNTVDVGARFGVIMVIVEEDNFEVATFRAEAPYLDGRRPSAVSFGTIEEDVHRRDFTIGGMYYDPATEGGAARGLDLLVDSGLAAVIIPEVLELKGCLQPPNFHPEGDVYRHTRLM